MAYVTLRFLRKITYRLSNIDIIKFLFFERIVKLEPDLVLGPWIDQLADSSPIGF